MTEYQSTDDNAIYTLVPAEEVVDWADVNGVHETFAVLRQEVIPFNKVAVIPQADGTITIEPHPMVEKLKMTRASDDGVKYYTEPENGMLRVIAARTFITAVGGHRVHKGDRGGLIAHPSNLSHEGLAWIDEDSVAEDRSEVRGNASVFHGSRIGGVVRLSGNAHVAGSIINSTSGKLDIFQNAVVHNSTINGTGNISGHARIDNCELHLMGDTIEGSVQLCRTTFETPRQALHLQAGRFEHAALRSTLDVFSINCEWGTLQFFPVKVGDGRYLRASVGCQTAHNVHELLAIARREDLAAWRVQQLELLIQVGVQTGRFFGAGNLGDWEIGGGA